MPNIQTEQTQERQLGFFLNTLFETSIFAIRSNVQQIKHCEVLFEELLFFRPFSVLSSRQVKAHDKRSGDFHHKTRSGLRTRTMKITSFLAPRKTEMLVPPPNVHNAKRWNFFAQTLDSKPTQTRQQDHNRASLCLFTPCFPCPFPLFWQMFDQKFWH